MHILDFLLISLLINLVLFIVAYYFQTDKLTDFSYSLSFILVSAYAFTKSPLGLTNLIGSALVWLWALRLGSYLVLRISRWGRDKRFDEMRQNFWAFGRFWLLQAISVVIILTPLLVLDGKQVDFSAASVVGLGIWAIGLVVEALADWQKFTFINAKRKGWIHEGVWRISRHPNYLGEITVWLGLYLYCLPYLSPTESLLGFISPLFIFVLLRFVSGVPLLEKSADTRWGNDPEYLRYKQKTGLIFPKVF